MGKPKSDAWLAKALGELDADTDWEELIKGLDIPSSVYRDAGKMEKSMEIARDAFTWATGECLERGIESGIGGAGCGRSRSDVSGCAEDLREFSEKVLGFADGIDGEAASAAGEKKFHDVKWPSKAEWRDLRLSVCGKLTKSKAMVWMQAFDSFLGLRGELVNDGEDGYRVELPASSVVLSVAAAGISHRSVRCELEMTHAMHRLYGSLLRRSFKADKRVSSLERGKVEAWLDGLDDQNLRAELVRVAAERSGAAKKAAKLRDELNAEKSARTQVQRDLEKAERELAAAKLEAARVDDDPEVVVDLRRAVDMLDAELKSAYSQLETAQKRVIELEKAAR